MSPGLLEQRNQNQAGIGPQGQAQGQDQSQQPIDPKTQEEFDMFVSNGMQILYDEKVAQTVVNNIMNSQDPITAIAQETLNIVDRLETNSAENGVQISDGAKVQGANHIMGEIMSLAEDAGSPKLSEEQRKQCWDMAIAKYLDDGVKSGKISQEQLMSQAEQIQGAPVQQTAERTLVGGQ